jgi:hypothetical protein
MIIPLFKMIRRANEIIYSVDGVDMYGNASTAKNTDNRSVSK